jgi:hypothetical protein
MEEAITEIKKAVETARTDVLNSVLEGCSKCKDPEQLFTL